MKYIESSMLEHLFAQWPGVSFPELSGQQIGTIIARHGLNVSLEEVTELPRVGTVNTAYALGENYVLRVPRDHPAAVGDTYTESVAAPVATAAKVRTPALLVFDDSRKILDVPYTVYERVDGQNFGLADTDVDANAHVYREIGRQLSILHHSVENCPDPHGYLDQPCRLDPSEFLEQLGSAALLSASNIQWLNRVFRRLGPAVEEAKEFRRFLHNDALPTNVLVKDGAFAALIDWNDAGWGDPALEFASLPSRAIPHALAGYREIAALDGDRTAEWRILWDHLCLALKCLPLLPRYRNISWARPPFARLTELLAGAAKVEAWQELLR